MEHTRCFLLLLQLLTLPLPLVLRVALYQWTSCLWLLAGLGQWEAEEGNVVVPSFCL